MFSDLTGQGWRQVAELGLAFSLSALIGVEREIRHKSAGLRTYTLVGLSAALIMLISKYGFSNVLVNDRVVLDPSRIAAQIVTGIGFIGGGLIFVRRDNVRGLTTAAIVWLTAAVGMACGAGLPVLALFVTACHFVIVFGFSAIVRRLPRSRWIPSALRISYQDGEEALREIVIACTRLDFAVSRLQVERSSGAPETAADSREDVNASQESVPSVGIEPGEDRRVASLPIVIVYLEVQGTTPISKLATKLANIRGVVSVNAGDVNVVSE